MIDSHAHILAEQFDQDRDAVIARCKNVGVTWIEVGTNIDTSRKAIAFAEKYSNIVASVGVHPHEIAGMHEQDWKEIERLITANIAVAPHPRLPSGQANPLPIRGEGIVRAIGEVGLDFSPSSRCPASLQGYALQEQVLRRFIALAQNKQLPMIFHVRSGGVLDAHQELIRILKGYSDGDRPRGVIHTFSGTLLQAQEYIALGMVISFSGVITFKNAGELPEIVKTIPIEKMLVETDCPYLTPDPFRGKRNEPMYIKYIIQKIADLREASFEEMEHATEENAKELFGLHKFRNI